MSEGGIRIALADDQALVRAGLRALLQQQGIDIVFEADDGQALLDALQATPVDIVLSDIRMPGMDGIAALEALRARGDATPVLLLTTFDDAELLLRATEAGAQGFLLKDAAPDDLRDAILRLIAGGYSNKEIARSLFLAEGTVKNYVSEILDKLGTRDRTRAVLKAITLRII